MKKATVRTRFSTQLLTGVAIIASILSAVFFLAACDSNAPSGNDQRNQAKRLSLTSAVPLGSASTFAVLAATTVTNDGPSLLTGDLGVSPGTAITGFQPSPLNTIMGPGTVTAGLGIVNGTIYAGGPVAAQAQVDAHIAYEYLVAQVPNVIYPDIVNQLDGLTFTPGVYRFPSSADLLVNGTVYLDFQGNNDAQFIFQIGSTLVTKADSRVVAVNNNDQSCTGSNVYWAVGSSATIDGAQFIGTVIAHTTITMTSAANTSGTNVSGRMLALGGAVTMVTDTISVCGSSDGGFPPKPCKDFVTGGGWIEGKSDPRGHKNNKATFGVSGGIKNGKFWGQLSFKDHGKNGVKVKSSRVTAYIVLDPVTRQIEGVAKVNGQGSFTYKVVVVDNGEPGRDDIFSLELSNGYSASGTLKGGNIQLHKKCGDGHDKGNKGGKDDDENDDDKDERDGHSSCDNDRD